MTTTPDQPAGPKVEPSSGLTLHRVGFYGLAVLFAAMVIYLLLGMPGMDHTSGTTMPDHPGMSTPPELSVEAFAAALEDPDALVVNVHVPNDGDIPGTDAAVDYRTIGSWNGLPGDPLARIVLYCQSGNMSAQAAMTLSMMGYRNVSHLAGGMNLWRAQGLPVADD